MSKLITRSGVDNLPTPSDYQPDIEILENSTRNALGTLLREIIAYKTKLNCKWNYMTKEQYMTLQQIRKMKSFDCAYYNPETDSIKTITCYCRTCKSNTTKS